MTNSTECYLCGKDCEMKCFTCNHKYCDDCLFNKDHLEFHFTWGMQ